MTNWNKDEPQQQPAQYPPPPATPSSAGGPPPAPYGSYQGAPAGYGGYPQPPGSNGMAIAALVCGILGLLIFWFILGPLAIIFGIIGLNRANSGRASGKGMAIAGIVLGAVALIGYIVLLAVLANRGFVI